MNLKLRTIGFAIGITILAGALANVTLQIGNNSKISFKNMLNVNTTNYTTIRTGKDFESNSTTGDNIKASELAYKANTFRFSHDL